SIALVDARGPSATGTPEPSRPAKADNTAWQQAVSNNSAPDRDFKASKTSSARRVSAAAPAGFAPVARACPRRRKTNATALRYEAISGLSLTRTSQRSIAWE